MKSGPSTRQELLAVLRRDLAVLGARPADLAQPWVLFLIVCTLFPLGASPGPLLLAEIAPAVVWVGVLMALLPALEPLVRADLQDGTADRLLLSPAPLPLIVLAKAAVACIAVALPLMLIAPVAGWLFGLPWQAVPVLAASLALGTPTLCLLGLAGAALVVGLPRGGLLLPLLLLPLLVPVLIFAAGAVRAAAQGFPAEPALRMLAALALLALSLAPFATAAALRLRAQSG
jgi:heme exporter protein B